MRRDDPCPQALDEADPGYAARMVAYEGFGFTELGAREWAAAGVRPDIGVEWAAQNIKPLHASHWLTLLLDASLPWWPWHPPVHTPGDCPDCGNTLLRVSVWRDAGYPDPVDALAWESHGLAPLDARRWASVGVNRAGEAARWAAHGFTVGKAGGWIREGWDATESVEWDFQGFSPWEANAWRAAGYGAGGAALWEREGFTPANATEWDAFGFDPADAARWVALVRGYTPAEAAEWAAVGLRAPRFAVTWECHGFTAGESGVWLQAKVDDPQVALAHIADHPDGTRDILTTALQAGYTPVEARGLDLTDPVVVAGVRTVAALRKPVNT